MNAFLLHRRRRAGCKLLELVLPEAAYAAFLAWGFAPKSASLLHAIAFVAVMYAVAWFMYRRRWFVKV